MNNLRRKLVLSTWRAPKEGNIYGKLTLNAELVLRYIKYRTEQSKQKITLTHFVGCTLAKAIKETPEINGFIRMGGFVPHDNVAISFLIALEEGGNLANKKVHDADKSNLEEMSKALKSAAISLRKGEDKEFEKTQSSLRWMPTWLIRPLLWVTGWLSSSIGVSLPMFGLEAFPFGSCMITSVGMFGLDEGYAPHTPFARVPLIVLIGALRETPIVEDGEVVIAPMITLTATIDHRYIDGSQGGNLAKTIRMIFEKPWLCDGLSEPPEDFTV
jgi:pyruvate dehydrogenase E2 component (dihydrolipoamide acetyltransferase)